MTETEPKLTRRKLIVLAAAATAGALVGGQAIFESSTSKSGGRPHRPPLKPLLAGLQNRNREPVAGQLVPNTERKWDLMNPAPGAFNDANMAVLLAKGPFRLRPMMGRFAPDWLKAQAGTFVYEEPQSGITVPDMLCWWRNAAMDAADAFYAWLAQYDGQLHHVWGSSAMSFYAEPFQRGLASSVTRASLIAAGFTAEKDLVAIDRMQQSLVQFKQTRIGIAYNSYQHLNSDGSWFADRTTRDDKMTALRAMKAQAVLANNSFRETYLQNPITANGGVYGTMFRLGKPYSVQTAQLKLVGDLRKCLAYLGTAGFHAAELPAGHDLTPLEIAAFDADLKANV